MKYKHIVVVRLGLKWRYSELNQTWEEWLSNSVILMDTYCRPSLKHQNVQDFDIITLVDSTVNEYGNVLKNEIILKFDSDSDLNTKWEGDENGLMVKTINKHISKNYKDFTHILLTRLDRDDAIRYDYLMNVRKNINGLKEQYIDTKSVYHYKNGVFFKCPKYLENGMVSPFVSSLEKINDGKIRCVPFFKSHTYTKKHLIGKKHKNLYALQIIHENNFSNKLKSDVIVKSINKSDYGI